MERGCYGCLQEAARRLRDLARQAPGSGEVLAAERAANLMLAIRERELRIKPSDAAEKAYGSGPPAALSRESFAQILDLFFNRAELHSALIATDTETRDAGEQLASWLRHHFPPGIVAQYAAVIRDCADGGESDRAMRAADEVGAQRPVLALRYAHLRCASAFSDAEAVRILSEEPRFGEVHLERGLDAVARGLLLPARRELMLAHTALPESQAVSLKLADVMLALSMFDEALRLFDTVLAADRDPQALMGRVKALSYLGRARDALATLDELLSDPGWNPGETHYWRAWNQLQLPDLQSAEASVILAMQSWSAPHVHTLGGVVALGLGNLSEARRRLVAALRAGEDCEASSHLAQIDAREEKWPAAFEGSVATAACVARVVKQLAGQSPRGPMSAGEEARLATASAGELERWRRILASARYNAAVSAKILGLRETALGCARLVLDDPSYGGVARDFVLDIDVPAPQFLDAEGRRRVEGIRCHAE